MKSSGGLSGPPTPLRPISMRPATADRERAAASSAAAEAGEAASTKNNDALALLNNECSSSTPLGDTPTALSLPPPPATHVSDLGDDLLREILAKTGVLDRAVTARLVCRGWRAALAPPKSSASTPTFNQLALNSSPSGPTTSKRGKGLCADVDVTTEPRLLCRLDTDLLLRLLWLSSWGGDPRAADVPSWSSSFPWLRSLKLRGAGWRPTAAHRAPSLRRVLAACPRLVKIDATNLKVLVPLTRIGASCSSSSDNGERAATLQAAEDLLFDAGEAQLLAAAALHHGSVRELELDVSVRISVEDADEPPVRMEEDEADEDDEGEEEAQRRGVWEKEEGDDENTTATSMETDFPSSSCPSTSHPPLRLLPVAAIAADPSARIHSAVDVAETVLAGKTPLRVRRLSVSTPPTTMASSTTAEASNSTAVSAKRCLRLGRAVALGGELRTLTLDRLTPEEAAAAVSGALSSLSSNEQKKKSNSNNQLRRIEFRGVGGGALCCWSPEMKRAFSACADSTSGLREIVFEGDAGGATDEERELVEASVRASTDNDKVSVLFVEESPARKASGAAYAARAAAAAAAAEARARAQEQAVEAAVASVPPALPAAVQV